MFNKREWKAREVEFPGKRILRDAATGAENSVFVTRDEGAVTEMGDSFSASNMNDLENRVQTGIAEAAMSYSETEQATGGTWFDGKPIYRVSKYFSNVKFGGVGQWTTVGDLPIDMTASQYNVVDIDVRLLMGINDKHKTCAGVRLPIYDAGGALSSPWMMSGTQLAFNWRGGTTKPFDSCAVLVTIYYTKN
jgi:hypothetical protein